MFSHKPQVVIMTTIMSIFLMLTLGIPYAIILTVVFGLLLNTIFKGV